jgi:diketogulonate reductase-like aldo/keto reductase
MINIFMCWVYRPVAMYRDKPGYDKALTANPYPTWLKLEEMVTKGKIRNIGLSKCVMESVFDH